MDIFKIFVEVKNVDGNGAVQKVNQSQQKTTDTVETILPFFYSTKHINFPNQVLVLGVILGLDFIFSSVNSLIYSNSKLFHSLLLLGRK